MPPSKNHLQQRSPVKFTGLFLSGGSAALRKIEVNLSGPLHMPLTKPNPSYMPKYVIERDIPGAGALTSEQLKGISQTSCGVLSNLGPQIQWVHSYVTDNKIYCVYNAPNEEMIREHAKQGGFPANAVSRVSMIIDPTTAE
jgi:hypothetical protein